MASSTSQSSLTIGEKDPEYLYFLLSREITAAHAPSAEL
jgi:hypothetical protein